MPVEKAKEIMKEEWARISQEDIRARIREIPWHCQSLAKTGGGRIRSGLW